MTELNSQMRWIGLDVGSTTVKIAVVDPQTGALLHGNYLRHNAKQGEVAAALLQEAQNLFPSSSWKLAVCGSGGQPFAEMLDAHYVQEVVANSLAIRQMYPQTRVAIELGGQDAKVVFFERDAVTGQLLASDMRMNGVCAGGTGAFLDQVGELLGIPVEEFDAWAAKGTHVHEISGRCGVFAKTDIQPLLNQGVGREDIALSAYHAIAKQTIGGLAQGLEIEAPVLFEGGPLMHCPTLVRVFRERLGLTEVDGVVPQRADILVAWGAALSLGSLFAEQECGYHTGLIAELLLPRQNSESSQGRVAGSLSGGAYFESTEDRESFAQRHGLSVPKPSMPERGSVLRVWLGIDAGSTTTKFVLLNESGSVADTFYASNEGDPLRIVRQGLLDLRTRYEDAGVALEILGVGTTGYGERLFAKALRADMHTVETVAHARAAREICSDVSFILDIGGQDMKAITLQDGVVTGIVLNEACSSGCGSFVETYARSLGVPVEQIAELAFAARQPSHLGSRCTVFMNSSIITEQREGRTPGDILAGVCRSIIENVFTKVVRLRNMESLGKHVVVQGGTFRNDAVLRAFEQYTGLTPVRPAYPGEMGAIGIALLAKEQCELRLTQDPAWTSSFVGLDTLDDFAWQMESGQVCTYCSNHCSRTIVTFSDGNCHVTGNRCSRGEVVSDPSRPESREAVARIQKQMDSVPDLYKRQVRFLMTDFVKTPLLPANGIRIGIPRVLEFWESLPFWRTFFQALGYDPVVSRLSTHELYEEGLSAVPSDTACYPAKLVHGHILDLVKKKVDRLFLPVFVSLPTQHAQFKATAVCPLIQGYPLVVRNSDQPEEKYGIPLEQPTFHWTTPELRRSQCVRWFSENWGLSAKVVGQAVDMGVRALAEVRDTLQAEGKAVLEQVRKDGRFAVVVGGRPYHIDPHINHHVASHFVQQGIPVLTLESLPGVYDQDLSSHTRLEILNSFHCKLMAAAKLTAKDPALELVQIVSFGCGHDASITDELSRMLRVNGNKDLLMLKLDEGDVRGPMSIRIQSFVETVKARRAQPVALPTETVPLFPVTFQKEDKARRKILIPNLSPGFTRLVQGIFQEQGFDCEQLPLADSHAIALGKKFVHNDICFPAQINVGEALSWLEKNRDVPQENLALGLAKNCENCRAGQYAALARKALDEAGFAGIPIVTTGRDTKESHPGFRTNLDFRIKMLWGMAMLDGLEAMVRTVRPYEVDAGSTQIIYEHWVRDVMDACARKPRLGLAAFAQAIEAFNGIAVERSVRRPRVGILGEILMKYHPAANGQVEAYLEERGMEIVRPGMIDFFRREELIRDNKRQRGLLDNALRNLLIGGVTSALYSHAVREVEKRFKKFRWYEKHADCYEMVHMVSDMIDPSYVTGEGWLIPAEILALAAEGVNSFVIVQPFACLANHVSGRGMTKALKERHPHIQILSLDYDPDTSLANIENRLQMLLLNARDLERRRSGAVIA